MRRFYPPPSDKGASLVEFAIFIPILILFFIGLVEFGRLMREVTWVAQTAYEAARLGGETPSSIGLSVMDSRVEELGGVQGNQLTVPLSQNNGNATYSYDPDTKMVTVTMDGNLQPILRSLFPLDLALSVTGPMLLKNEDVPVDLSTPANPNCRYYCPGTQEPCCPEDGNLAMCPPTSNSCVQNPAPLPPGGGGYGGGGGGGGCFLGGTLITMADGRQKPIESVELGEEVMAYDESDGTLKPGKVTRLYVHMVKGYWVINGHLYVTPNHPVLVNGGWMRVQHLKPGDSLTDGTGNQVPVNSIQRYDDSEVVVYNFEIDQYHTYLANGSVVHNARMKDVEQGGGSILD